ncbi:caldesmon [Dryobates pubescens]|uniref:caldesmon n=1 Tax=Dryobates pubescens TaxID=118200 RepID=UPI0023BA0C02|nr:caldesmon [Dryobates pubescens]
MDDDFERRRELRRKKREGMRLEVESLSYQRNDDDEEEAARERRRRARQERLRQMEEGDLSGEVTEKTETSTQNSVAEEETKNATSTRGPDDEAALLERLARREERRQKRLQEALERQKELDPTITDGSLSQPSRKAVTSVEENETTGKEEKAETRRGRYETEETETVTKSYQRNNWRQDGEEEGKKEETDKEEVQEEKPKEVLIEENQVDVTAEKPTDKEEVVETNNLALNAEEHKIENDTNAVPEGEQSISDVLDKQKLKDEEKAEEERKQAEEREKLKAEERERLKAEEERKAAEEKQKAEEEKRAAEEREKAKAEEERKAAEEMERAKAEEERKAAEEMERAKAEEEKRAAEERERAKAEEEKRAAEERARAKAEEEKRAAEEKARLEAEKLQEKQKMERKKIEEKQVKEKKAQEEKPQAAFLIKQGEEIEIKVDARKEKLPDEKLQPASKKDQVKDDQDKGKAPKEEMKSIWDRKKGVPEQKAQNGERELTAPKLKPTENAFGRSNLKGTANAEEAKLKEKQQEAAAELDELKRRREERRRILEEEEQKKKQEEAERKAREEEDKRRMKEEIERRRAEAAEKRQKMPEDGVSEDKKPFKCFSPKGSSLKIEERAEFLNKSAQKSGMKPSHTTAVVSKIDSRLEQYTSAIEGTKATRPARAAASDLHVPAEGVRNIKSMWEKGNVFSSPSGTGTPNKETAGLKVGVSSRINEWLTKTPESNKSPAPKPSDLKPGDVSGKRNLWEKQSVEKSAASKVSAMGKKSETNGLRQLEKEP